MRQQIAEYAGRRTVGTNNQSITLRYWMVLPTCENTLLAFEPMSRTVPTTITRITASITAYSAISWPLSSSTNARQTAFVIFATGSLISLSVSPVNPSCQSGNDTRIEKYTDRVSCCPEAGLD